MQNHTQNNNTQYYTISRTALCIMILSNLTLSRMTLSIMALSPKDLIEQHI
jgi:hypothetical protein